MYKTKLVHLITVACAVAAMALPYGAVCRYMSPDSVNGASKEIVETYSYFSLIPYGYANFAPLITAVLTCVLLLLVLMLFANADTKPVKLATAIVSGAAFVTSLLPAVLFGVQYVTSISLVVSFLLGCSLWMSIQHCTGRYYEEEKDETEE